MRQRIKAILAALMTVFMLATAAVPAFAAESKALAGATGVAGTASVAGSVSATAVSAKASGSYQSVAAEYIALNALRREPFVSYLNADNVTRTFYNTNLFDQLPVLTYNAELEKAAKVRAKEIVTLFSHTRPNGQRCFTAYPSMSALGENIAYGQSSVTEVMLAFAEINDNYAGQGHRRNMLSPNFNAVGCACYKVNGVCYWVQCFGRV